MKKYLKNNYEGIEEDLSLKSIGLFFGISLLIGIGQFFILLILFA